MATPGGVELQKHSLAAKCNVFQGVASHNSHRLAVVSRRLFRLDALLKLASLQHDAGAELDWIHTQESLEIWSHGQRALFLGTTVNSCKVIFTACPRPITHLEIFPEAWKLLDSYISQNVFVLCCLDCKSRSLFLLQTKEVQSLLVSWINIDEVHLSKQGICQLVKSWEKCFGVSGVLQEHYLLSELIAKEA